MSGAPLYVCIVCDGMRVSLPICVMYGKLYNWNTAHLY